MVSAGLVSAELVSAELVSAELVSAELVSAELVSAGMVSAEPCLSNFTGARGRADPLCLTGVLMVCTMRASCAVYFLSQPFGWLR